MLKSMTLRGKIILGGLVAVIIPFLISGTIIFVNMTNSLKEIHISKSIQVAEDISVLIDSILFEELKFVKTLSVNNKVIEAVSTGNFMLADKELLYIHNKAYLEKDAIFIADENGIIRADPSHPEQIGLDISFRKYFKTAISGEANFSDVIITKGPAFSPWAGDKVIVVCAPVKTDNGIKGIVSLVIEINYIMEKIISIQSGKTGFPFIINKDGMIIVHPDNDRIFNVNIFNEPGFEELTDLIKKENNGAGKYIYEGVEKIAGFSIIESTGWTVVFTQNSEEIFEPVNSVIILLFINGGLFIIVTILFIILMSTKISSPVQKMIDIAKQVTRYSEDIIINIGLDKRIKFVNPAVEKIMGIPNSKIVGTKAILTNTQNISDEDIWELLDNHKSWTGRIIINNPDGKKSTIAVLIMPVIETNGVLRGYIEIGKDITNELLLESRLEQSQKMEVLGAISGGIAHDFNNILSCIFGYSELALALDGNPQKTVDFINGILAAAEGARDLVQQILTFSRHKEIEPRPVTAKYIIKDAMKLIQASIPVTIELRIYLKSNSVIMAEPIQLNQIIVNLCTNSVHAITNEKGIIEVKLVDRALDENFTKNHPELEPGKYLLLSVSDTGNGIKEEILNRIFEPFFTTKPRGKGTGLGLSVVHGIIKKLNGTILVESKVGKGTVFEIYLPVFSGKYVETDDSKPIVTKGNERIMLIDDEEPIISVLKKILTNLGYKVSDFMDSRKALKAFEKNPDNYDIIITDNLMPYITGLKLCKKLKKIRSDIPIILNTGFLSKEVEEKAYKIGIFKILTKPLNTYKLTDAIRKAVEKGSFGQTV